MLKSSKGAITCVLLLPSLWSHSLEARVMASQRCAQQQQQGRTRYPRLAKPFPAHNQDLRTTHPVRATVLQQGRPASLTAGMFLLSLCAKPLHMQLRAQYLTSQ